MKLSLLLTIVFVNFTVHAKVNNHSTLSTIVKETLKAHYDISLSELKTKETKSDELKKLAEFDLNLSYTFSYSDTTTPSSSTFDNNGSSLAIKTTEHIQKLELTKTFDTGTELSLPLSYNKDTTTSSSSLLPKNYSPSLGFSITQQLMGIGKKNYFDRSYQVSLLASKVAASEHKEKINKELLKTANLYYDLLQSYHVTNLYKKSQTIAANKLKFIEKKKKLGSASLIEVLDARSAYAKASEKVLNEQISYQNKFKKLNSSVHQSESIAKLSEKFGPISYELKEDKLITSELYQSALKNRPESIRHKEQVSMEHFKNRNTGIDLLPKAELSLDYTNNSLNADFSKAKSEVLSADFNTTKVGLSISRGLFNYASVGAKEVQELKLSQEQLKEQKYQQDLKSEVTLSINKILAQREIIKAMKTSFDAEKVKMEYYEKSLKRGRLSVFDYYKNKEQRDRAELEYIKAIIKYNKQNLALAQAQGVLVEHLLGSAKL
jgi:outer membrane protein TolC